MAGFPAIHVNEAPPAPGYEALNFRIRANLPQSVYDDLAGGNLKTKAGREKLGRALVAIYGESQVAGCDFSSPEPALATIEDPNLPIDLQEWLLVRPIRLTQERLEMVQKKSLSSSAIDG